MHKEEVERRTILRGLVGSTVHGLSVDDGNDDRDEMGICIEPIEYVLLQNFEQLIYRTAAIREGNPNARSRAGDLDLTIYSLRKWTKLALDGNPTILTLLFTPDRELVVQDRLGERLRQLAPAFASKRAGGRFLGYLTSQKMRLTGERGGKDVRRPELESKYGYDTKYAMHALRLGFQGVEYMSTGKITLPMPGEHMAICRAVRGGNVPLSTVVNIAETLELRLKELKEDGPLPSQPDFHAVEKFVRDCYFGSWLREEFPDMHCEANHASS